MGHITCSHKENEKNSGIFGFLRDIFILNSIFNHFPCKFHQIQRRQSISLMDKPIVRWFP